MIFMENGHQQRLNRVPECDVKFLPRLVNILVTLNIKRLSR